MKSKSFNYNIIESSWGFLCAVWSRQGLYSLSFPRSNKAAALKYLCVDAALAEHDDAYILEQELKLYFNGYKVTFSATVDLTGYSSFAYNVLSALRNVDYGETISYAELAEVAHFPGRARAVGRIMAINRTPIVLPCHRVIKKDGRMGGFAGGLELKKALLLMEEQVRSI